MRGLIPWRRSQEVPRLQGDINDIFDRFFEGFPSASLEGEAWLPTVDLSEKKDKVIVKAEIPGMEAKDFDISVDGRYLSIKGEKKEESEKSEENYYRKESQYGYFNRRVELPAEVDDSDVEAKYKRGVLKIELKKSKEAENKRIEVKAE